jgi:hypothetical protein
MRTRPRYRTATGLQAPGRNRDLVENPRALALGFMRHNGLAGVPDHQGSLMTTNPTSTTPIGRIPDDAEDPWAHLRDPELAEQRADQVLCTFHDRNPDVDDPDLGDYCEDCEVERYYHRLEDQAPDLPDGHGLDPSEDPF